MEPSESSNEEQLGQLERLKQYLGHTPDNLNLLTDAIALAIDIQSWETAEELIPQALKYHPESAEINAHAGFFFMRANELATAQGHFETSIENGLNQPAIVYNLAFTQYLQRDFEAASKTLSTIDNQEAVLRESTLLFARCQHNISEMDDAIAQLKTFIDTNNDDEAEGLLALMLCDQGDSEDAMLHANHCLELNPTQQEALVARGALHLAAGDFDQSYVDYKTATEVHPDNGRAWSGRAQLDFRNFQFDDALVGLNKAVKTMPDHIGTWHILAWTHLVKNDVPSAKYAFEKAYDIDRNFGETHGGLASIYALEGNTQLAEKHIKIAEKLDNSGFSATYARMVLLNQKGQGTEALNLLEQVKNTPNAILGTTPKTLIDARMAELMKEHGNKPTLN